MELIHLKDRAARGVAGYMNLDLPAFRAQRHTRRDEPLVIAVRVRNEPRVLVLEGLERKYRTRIAASAQQLAIAAIVRAHIDDGVNVMRFEQPEKASFGGLDRIVAIDLDTEA
jgi:hypothetical protein